MGRYEMALLFPDAKTKHRPRSGGPITLRDVAKARKKYAKLAQRIAAFHKLHAHPHPPVMVASLSNSPSEVTDGSRTTAAATPAFSVPRPVLASLDRSPAAIPRAVVASLESGPTEVRRTRLGKPAKQRRLASLQPDNAMTGSGPVPRPQLAEPPRNADGTDLYGSQKSAEHVFIELTGWATAPEYDPEHPSELIYRPFPIAPLLSENSSIDNPALATLVPPDMARARDLIAMTEEGLPLHFKPGLQFAEMLWSDLFAGGTVDGLMAISVNERGRGSRRVRTAQSN